MYTSEHKPKPGLRANSSKIIQPNQVKSSQDHQNHSIIRSQRWKETNRNTGDLTGDPATKETLGFSHNFSRIPVHPGTPLKIQTKLTVSHSGDQYEQEADHVANAVMAGYPRPIGHISKGIQPMLSRMEVSPEYFGISPEDQADSMLRSEGAAVVKSPGTRPTEKMQRKSTGNAGTVTPHFEQSLQQAVHHGGEALSPSSRSFMESRFGHDFSSVQVHSDALANTLAREVNARAFTVNKNIFFARSEYQPTSHEGQRLLAHELTHVLQQSEGRISRQIQRQTSCSSYNGYNASVNLYTYNCAGLATRTYLDISPPSHVYDSIMANFKNPISPLEGKCNPGAVKFWLWEYDLHLEDDRGNTTAPQPDFHVVAGQTDNITGADPTNVYSKNGHRRVHGPGTGPGFRPAARQRALLNNPSETPAISAQGRPIFKVRTNMSQAISCAGCY